jgi:hypothetical protein
MSDDESGVGRRLVRWVGQAGEKVIAGAYVALMSGVIATFLWPCSWGRCG